MEGMRKRRGGHGREHERERKGGKVSLNYVFLPGTASFQYSQEGSSFLR